MRPYDYLFEENQPSLKTLSISDLADFVTNIDNDVSDMVKSQKTNEYEELIKIYLKARKEAESASAFVLKRGMTL